MVFDTQNEEMCAVVEAVQLEKTFQEGEQHGAGCLKSILQIKSVREMSFPWIKSRTVRLTYIIASVIYSFLC